MVKKYQKNKPETCQKSLVDQTKKNKATLTTSTIPKEHTLQL